MTPVQLFVDYKGREVNNNLIKAINILQHDQHQHDYHPYS